MVCKTFGYLMFNVEILSSYHILLLIKHEHQFGVKKCHYLFTKTFFFHEPQVLNFKDKIGIDHVS
mgnify:CR=1 FL=1